MIRLIRQIIKRIRLRKRDASTALKKEGFERVIPCVSDITGLLGIECPDLCFVGCIFNKFLARYGQSMQLIQPRLYVKELNPSDNYCGAVYMDDEDCIYIAHYKYRMNYKKLEKYLAHTTEGELLFILAHELRHVWQKEYEPEKYYMKNAVGREIIGDAAEIDADAFAIAYMCSGRNPFQKDDFSLPAEQMHIQGTIDMGQRWERARDLSREYGFNCRKAIWDMEKSLDIDTVSTAVALLLEQGMV